MRHLSFDIGRYDLLFRFIFEQAVDRWRLAHYPLDKQGAQLLRVYWYVLSIIDEWDFSDLKVVEHLRHLFLSDKKVKSDWLAQAGQMFEGRNDVAKLEENAFQLWFQDIKKWYESKQETIKGYNRFYYGVETSTEFVEVRRTGRWKVDFLNKQVGEKGVDTSLAVDMVGLAPSYDVAILISGDADTIPSLQFVRNAGKQVGVVEFLKGFPPEQRGRQFSSKLKTASDFVVQIYEMDLKRKDIEKKGGSSDK